MKQNVMQFKKKEFMEIGQKVILKNIEANDRQWLIRYRQKTGVIVGHDLRHPPLVVRVSFGNGTSRAEYEDLAAWRLEKSL